MSDWTVPPIPADQQPPGPISPPPPDQIQPTDPGWSAFVRKEADKTGLKVTPDCSVSIEVVATGYSVVRPVDGDNPTDYAADKDWGWKADRVYETQPPEPYQDFTVLTPTRRRPSRDFGGYEPAPWRPTDLRRRARSKVRTAASSGFMPASSSRQAVSPSRTISSARLPPR